MPMSPTVVDLSAKSRTQTGLQKRRGVMTPIRSFVSGHPLLSYFALTFAISWGALLVMILRNGFPTSKESLNAQLPVAILAMLGGPSISGVLMTALIDGKAGLRSLLSRMLKWQVGARWYVMALLVGPLSMLAALGVAFLLTPRLHVPGLFASVNKMSVLLSGVIGGVIVGICEELGWTGFALPRLRLHHSMLSSGLILGVIWGAWHVLSNVVWAIHTYSGALSPTRTAILTGIGFLVGQLPPFRILLVWVYDRSGSLLIAMLMHASLTASTLILANLPISGTLYGILLAVSMWFIAATVIVKNRRELTT